MNHCETIANCCICGIDSNSVLVPLTNSLYVRGELANSDSVLVDVGTGFLVEKVCGAGCAGSKTVRRFLKRRANLRNRN